MRIVVTGSGGRIGRYVVRDLIAAGHAVTGADLAPPPEGGAGQFLRVDLTDAGQVYGALARSRAEAVVHLGAWSSAGQAPDARTYGDNVRGTYHVFQACADLGVRRVISASSQQAYGVDAAPPLYVPIDEDHPLRPSNCYGLSKAAGEQAADYFVAQHGLEILSFRFLGVRAPAEMPAEVERVLRHPEQKLRLFWTRCDARDAALACRLAVEADHVEPGPYNITGPRVIPDVDSAELVAQYFPTTEIRPALTGRTSPMSCARAEAAFGYRPCYPWSAQERHPA